MSDAFRFVDKSIAGGDGGGKSLESGALFCCKQNKCLSLNQS